MKIKQSELKEIGEIHLKKGNTSVVLSTDKEDADALNLSINVEKELKSKEEVYSSLSLPNVTKIKEVIDRSDKLYPPKKRIKGSLDIKNELERRLQYVQEEVSTLELDKLTQATAYASLTKISNEIEIINGIAKEFYNSWYSEKSKNFDYEIKKEVNDFLNVDLKECKNIEENKEKIQEETNNNA